MARFGLFMLNVGTDEEAAYRPLLATDTIRYFVKGKARDAVRGFVLTESGSAKFVSMAEFGSGPGKVRKPKSDELIGNVKGLEDAKAAELNSQAKKPDKKKKAKKAKKKAKKKG